MRSTFSFIWTIENLSDLTLIDFKSPTFVVKTIGDKELHLEIDDCFNICCRIRTNDMYNERIDDLDFEFSFLGADGSPLISKRSAKPNLFLVLMGRTDFNNRRNEFVLNNTLTVQCRMWRSDREIPADVCYATTRLKTRAESFMWAIEEFSTLRSSAAEEEVEPEETISANPDERKVYPLKPVTDKGPFLALVLYLKQHSESEELYVRFLLEKGREFTFGYELSLLDANGNVIVSKVGKDRVMYGWAIFPRHPFISKSKLIDNKKLFLPNDTLVLRCSYEVCHGVLSNELEYFTPNVSSVVKEVEEYRIYHIAEDENDDTLQFEEYFLK